MNAHEISIEVPSQGARRATEEGSQNGWKKPERFSARHKTEVVLRLLRGGAVDRLSRAPLARPGGPDDEPGHLALHGPVVWPGAGLPRVGRGTLHRLLAAARARDTASPTGPPWPLSGG